MIVLTLLVRDEADVVAANIEHHLDLGVDHMIVTDHCSVDETPDILRGYERAGVLSVIREDELAYLQAQWVTRMARRAEAMGATWVINSDADEFWWPTRGDLRSTLDNVERDVDGLVVDRHDFIGDTTSSAPWFERMVYRYAVSRNLLGEPLPPKVCHRAHPEVEVSMGNHDVSWGGRGLLEPVGELSIMHVPVRTRAQLEHKIAMGGDALKRTGTGPETGHVWRRLHEQLEADSFDTVLDRHAPDGAAIASMVASGEIVADDRLCRRVRRLAAGRRWISGPAGEVAGSDGLGVGTSSEHPPSDVTGQLIGPHDLDTVDEHVLDTDSLAPDSRGPSR